MSIKPWIAAARPKTLPLAVSNIFIGSAIAFSEKKFNLVVFILGLTTAILLQILSNYANDYGDFIKKADENRTSKYERALTSGRITPSQMRLMLIILSSFTFVTGIILIIMGLKGSGMAVYLFFLLVGLLSIAAALTYTMGKKPYGYAGLGDFSVFIFFGLVAVCGIYILHTKQWQWPVLLPASAFGLLSMGVLNINNIRDEASDRLAGKSTLVVKMGVQKAKIYHSIIVVTAIILAVCFTWIHYQTAFQWMFLLAVPLFFRNIYRINTSKSTDVYDEELKNLSLTILLFSITFGLGLAI
ncbi:MAG TPA: 1,4-dihydroxy-2-naphthoate octaprenyltransferase [Niabella sp.]|jgi:1,4-dihydroxy-2-naphthoate octaprenyltransferase|nr:1,4-dihydroxy-2-naphthoate octaprenyltransferase [Chitinophagaceae bacterium]HRO85961.1 1,4-dihydroxy-2-naphthoate octaprenyltransferase [Niabella sp.]